MPSLEEALNNYQLHEFLLLSVQSTLRLLGTARVKKKEKTENENDPVGSKVEDAMKGRGNWGNPFPGKGSPKRLTSPNLS